MRVRAIIVAVCAFLITWLFSHGRSTPYDNYVLFADAILHHRLWITWPGPYIDAVFFEGHRYIVNDPVPGIIMLPFVALFGLHANETLASCMLAGIATGVGWLLARNLGVEEGDADMLAAFLLLGTDLMWCAMLGDVWYMAHVACVMFLLLALCECTGSKRPWLIAFWFALACGSRFTVVLTLPAFAYWIANGFDVPLHAPRRLIPAALTLLPFALLWVGYNEARWHVPWDSGHTIFFHQDVHVGGEHGSPFAFSNVPYQAYSFFVQPPRFQTMAPFVIPEQMGQALIWTSPALILAFFAGARREVIVSLWLAIVLAAGPSFLYYVNGFIQFGMRHALDFEAFAFVLMVLAARRGLHPIWYALIAYSAVAGMYGAWYWNAVFRSTM